MTLFNHFLILVATANFLACSNSNQNENQAINKEVLRKKIEHVNQYMVQSENAEIDAYTNRHFTTINQTGTGLRYYIYEKGKGQAAKTGLIATLNYHVRLINGVDCYSSKIDGPKVFEIGKGNIEAGLEEGILLLHVGDKAKFILPSHLAFGLLGDQKKIPKRATIIYDVELINLSTKPKQQ